LNIAHRASGIIFRPIEVADHSPEANIAQQLQAVHREIVHPFRRKTKKKTADDLVHEND